MFLRVSSNAVNEQVDLRDAVDGDTADIAAATELLAFAEAAHRLDADLPDARSALISAVGTDGMVHAAMTSAVFRGLNITADASGIPIDDDWAEFVSSTAGELGTDRFASAANSPTIHPS